MPTKPAYDRTAIIKIQQQCPARRPFSCGIMDVELGYTTPIPMATCVSCFAMGGIQGGAAIRKQWQEAHLTITQDGPPRAGCASCGGVKELYKKYPDQVELFEKTALDRGYFLSQAGLYRNGVLQRVVALGDLVKLLDLELPAPTARAVFDRVVVISLARRSDRLAGFLQRVRALRWPLRDVEVVGAVDGECATPPDGWTAGNGAWGCRQSHTRVLEECLSRKIESVLIFEDDAHFEPSFAELPAFVDRVPGDWEILMLGGQHIGEVRCPPVPVEPGIVRCSNTQRCHAYGVRGAAIRDLYKLWSSWYPGLDEHCDHALGPWAGMRGTTYAPMPFMVSQGGSLSDICGRVQPVRNWS